MTFALEVAARTVWGECRGEPIAGQRAVAHVLANRLTDGRWGSSLSSVCLAPYQFSCWRPDDPNLVKMAALDDGDPSLATFGAFIEAALAGETDPTDGATFYYSVTQILPPEWAKTGAFTVQIGKHKFYRDVP